MAVDGAGVRDLAGLPTCFSTDMDNRWHLFPARPQFLHRLDRHQRHSFHPNLENRGHRPERGGSAMR